MNVGKQGLSLGQHLVATFSSAELLPWLVTNVT